MAVYVGSLMTNKDRRESYHREEPPIVLDRGIGSEDVHFTFIDIIPQVTNPHLSTLHTNRANTNYHNFSDLIKRANLWFLHNQEWRIVNCETVLLFFRQNDSGSWHLAAENSCFTLDKGAQSSLMALRLWISRSSHNQSESSHKMNHKTSVHLNGQPKISPSHNQLNHQTNHTCSTNQLMNHQSTSHSTNHTSHLMNHPHKSRHSSHRRSRNEKKSETNSPEQREESIKSSSNESESERKQLFVLKFRDFIPENRMPDDHSKFEKLDVVVDKLNAAILNGELLAENVITVETLYFPCECDWTIDNRLELTLHSFPSNYICILRVFYEDKPNDSSNNADEVLSEKLRKLNYAFQIQLRDFIPRTLSRGNFFKKPEFEQQSTCIKRAAQWIEQESKLHQIKFQSLIKQLGDEGDNFFFDFKNAQCIEVKTKVLKHNIDSTLMAHTSNSGDYIRIFRVAYMEVINLDQPKNEQPVHVSSKSIKKTFFNKSKQLIKSKQLSKSLAANKSCDRLIDRSFEELPTDHNSTIHLSSTIFTPNNSSTTIQEMKREIQSWSLTHCRDSQSESDELAKYSRKPRLLSAETVEIFTKNFLPEEIERETENCFNFNRIGTMNNFLYFSFRIYLDSLDRTNGTDYLELANTDDRNCRLKDDKCSIV